MLFAALGVAAFLVLVAAGSVYYELSKVRSDVNSARDTLVQAFADPAALQSREGRAATSVKVDAAINSLAAAQRRAAGSKPISMLRLLPKVGSQRTGLITLINDATTSAGAVRDLLGKVDALAGQSQFTDGRIPAEGLAELSADVRTAAGTIGGATRASSGLWGPLGDARDQFDRQARSSATRLTRGADAIDASRTFLGGAGDRRYFLALLNNAEMRDQGMVLSYAIVHFSDGRMTFEKSGSIQSLHLDEAAATPIPAGMAEAFGAFEPTKIWQSVNSSPDFAFTGRALTDMYKLKTGQAVDGVIAVDVPGVSALLRSVGPVTANGIAEPIDADNVSRIVLHDLYEAEPPGSDQSERRELLSEVTRAVVDKITQGTRDTFSIGQQLGDAAKGGHVRLWSSVGDEEKVFERSGIGGGPAPTDADRTFHVAVENRTATKLDYYVKPSVRQVVDLDAKGTATVHTTIVVDNQAPPDGAPSYQLGPDENTAKPGDYRADVLLWGPAGAIQEAGITESGLTLSRHVLPVSAGNSVQVAFDTVIPRAVRNGRLMLRLVPQARLEPMSLQVQLHAPGWQVDGSSSRRGAWDQVWTLDWRVRR